MSFKHKLYLIAFVFVSLLLLFVYLNGTEADNPKYMLLYRGANGINFYCLDYLPYERDRAMIWDSERGAIEVTGDSRLFAQVIEVDSCNLSNVYETNGQYYLWVFSSHNTDGHETHRHLTGGAWWVTWLGE